MSSISITCLVIYCSGSIRLGPGVPHQCSRVTKKEKVLNRGRDHTEAVRYDRSGATEVVDDLGEKY